MTRETAIKLFNQKQVRCHWDDDQEKYYFSVVDVVGVLTESENPQVYWRVLKKRLLEEGNETVTNCNALKMPAADGKMRLTDVADTEQLFRLISLYWDIGKSIIEKQTEFYWGKSVVEKLSVDLSEKTGDSLSFSSRNLWLMRQLYEGLQKFDFLAKFPHFCWLKHNS